MTYSNSLFNVFLQEIMFACSYNEGYFFVAMLLFTNYNQFVAI